MHLSIFRRPLVLISLAFAVLVALAIGVAIVGNNFRFKQESVTALGPDGELAGVLTLPPNGQARGLVVMVHGDGPIDATQQGLYSPWFEGAADSGFATLSWSKPGIDESNGDWLAQSMDDRAAEVTAVIDWAKRNDDVPTQTIVLWGASQAGWVLPKVVNSREDIDGVVAVAPAINWLRQGRFNLESELEHEGADAPEIARAIKDSNRTRKLLDREAPYTDYIDSTTSRDPMTEDRWSFVQRNFRANAVRDLTASASRKTPVHLMVGTHDRNVDVTETEKVYRSTLGSYLTVTHLEGAHTLARPIMEENDLVGFTTGILWPRALLAPRAIADYRTFLKTGPA
ncbi:MAG: alpha/beta hydrolase family protein [Brevibacterium aurantiacum]|uniref:alpha/beta hydrolase family protein n=1 Tax=Brevibacterium aurantiacum TaxID=273384 RepID=UPI003F8DF1B5